MSVGHTENPGSRHRAALTSKKKVLEDLAMAEAAGHLEQGTLEAEYWSSMSAKPRFLMRLAATSSCSAAFKQCLQEALPWKTCIKPIAYCEAVNPGDTQCNWTMRRQNAHNDHATAAADGWIYDI